MRCDKLWYLRVMTHYVLVRRAAVAWWRHQIETFSALLALCAGNSPVPGEFPAQRPVTQSFDVFYDLRLNKRLSEHSWGWWFETQSGSLWRHCNGLINNEVYRRKYGRHTNAVDSGWATQLYNYVMSDIRKWIHMLHKSIALVHEAHGLVSGQVSFNEKYLRSECNGLE